MDDLKLMTPKKVDGRAFKAVSIRPRHRELYAELQKPEHKGQFKSAMLAIGYPVSTAEHNGGIVQATKSWKALLDERLSEELLTRRHNELLNKRDTTTVTIGRGKKARIELIDHGPDTTAVARGLELAYKLRGSFVPEPVAAPPANVYNLFYSPQVRASVASFEAQLKHAIAHEISTNPAPALIQAPASDDTGAGTDAGNAAPSSE